MLTLKNLKAEREGKPILDGINLEVKSGEIHAIMGPNGSGKSTLSLAMMGHPDVKITYGEVILDGQSLNKLESNDRAVKGLFLAFQYPFEVPGVQYFEFLRLVYNSINKARNSDFAQVSPFKFKKIVQAKMIDLKMDPSFLERNLNEGFSGGEKKKSEILQMSVVEPKYAIMDETDSGLDVSALKIVAKTAKEYAEKNKIGLVVITHYKRLLDYLNPDHVHILFKGKIVKSGGMELAEYIDKNGYDEF